MRAAVFAGESAGKMGFFLPYPANIKGVVVAGASPSGTVNVQLASETAGTTVTIKAGSFIKYRSYT